MTADRTLLSSTKECDVRDRTEHGYFVVPLSTSAHAYATPEFSFGLRGPAALADVDPLLLGAVDGDRAASKSMEAGALFGRTFCER
jgi:hypothetical protein